MTDSWDEILLTCVHGIREGLDYHNCQECKKLAIKDGLTWIDKKETYVYTKEFMERRNANKK